MPYSDAVEKWRGPRGIDLDRVRTLHAARKTDREIAAAVGFDRQTVAVWRRRLGLGPAWATAAPSARARLSAAMRAACARRAAAGTGALAAGYHRRRAAERAGLAARYGLPPDLHPVQVRAVLALAGGPATASALADACGRSAAEPVGFRRFQRAGGNHLTDLRRLGLVAVACTRRGKGRGKGRGESLYLLTPHAMDLMAAAGGAA